MKREGNIHTVEEIEGLIRSTKHYRLVRNGARSKDFVLGNNSPSKVFSKVYEIYDGPFVFVIRLEFDYRIMRGRVTWQQIENTLFQAVPGMRQKLLSLYPVTSGWKREVISRKHIESTNPDIPYEIRKMADDTNHNTDKVTQQLAIDNLAEIRDFINEVIKSESSK